MVPADYKEFFLGAITVAGALVGLLFVAISVHPEGVGDEGHLTSRVRAASALSAFLDALFLSLAALLPHSSIGTTALILGISGALTMLTLLLFVLRQDRASGPWQLVRMGLLVIGQCTVYIVQIISAAHLLTSSDNTGQVNTQATLVIIFFAFGESALGSTSAVNARVCGAPSTKSDAPSFAEAPRTRIRCRTMTNRSILTIGVRKTTDLAKPT